MCSNQSIEAPLSALDPNGFDVGPCCYILNIPSSQHINSCIIVDSYSGIITSLCQRGCSFTGLFFCLTVPLGTVDDAIRMLVRREDHKTVYSLRGERADLMLKLLNDKFLETGRALTAHLLPRPYVRRT